MTNKVFLPNELALVTPTVREAIHNQLCTVLAALFCGGIQLKQGHSYAVRADLNYP